MASFDIVSKVDLQTLDNTINSARRELETRYDLRGANITIELDKKSMVVHISSDDEMKMEAVDGILIGRMVKAKLDPKYLDFGKERYAAGKSVKKDVTVSQGISKEIAKKIVKKIKDDKFKVQAQIMDDQVRVTAKKIDELQAVIAMCRREDFEVPLQFTNMK